MKPLEEWRDIKEIDELYQVSKLGRVQSLDRIVYFKNGRRIFYKDKVLKPSVNSTGYLTVNLYSNKQHTKTIHQLEIS